MRPSLNFRPTIEFLEDRTTPSVVTHSAPSVSSVVTHSAPSVSSVVAHNSLMNFFEKEKAILTSIESSLEKLPQTLRIQVAESLIQLEIDYISALLTGGGI